MARSRMSFSQATDYKVGTIPLVLDNRPSSPEMECTERKTTRSNPTGAGPSRIAEVREQQIDPAPCTLFSSSMGSFEVPDAARHRIEGELSPVHVHPLPLDIVSELTTKTRTCQNTFELPASCWRKSWVAPSLNVRTTTMSAKAKEKANK